MLQQLYVNRLLESGKLLVGLEDSDEIGVKRWYIVALDDSDEVRIKRWHMTALDDSD